MTAIIRLIFGLIISAICLATWTVVGLFYWLPLMARVCAAFTVGVLVAAISNTSADRAGNALNSAVLFYINGFRRIWAALAPIFSGHPEIAQTAEIDLQNAATFWNSVGFVLRETLIAILFWALFLLLAFPSLSSRAYHRAWSVKQLSATDDTAAVPESADETKERVSSSSTNGLDPHNAGMCSAAIQKAKNDNLLPLDADVTFEAERASDGSLSCGARTDDVFFNIWFNQSCTIAPQPDCISLLKVEKADGTLIYPK